MPWAVPPQHFSVEINIETLKRSIRMHLPRSMPDQAILGYALARLPRLVS